MKDLTNLGGFTIGREHKGKDRRNTSRERINEEIRDREVLLIDHMGKKIGAIQKFKALNMAREVQLDLVEVNPNARPPVCKIMDYGKFKFERSKREHQAAKKQHQVKIKEIRISAKIGDHDLGVKIKNAREMLIDGDRVEFTLRFKGREIAHSAIGRTVLEKVRSSLVDIASIESDIKSYGKVMKLILAPEKKAIEKIRQQRRESMSQRISSRKSKRTSKALNKIEKSGSAKLEVVDSEKEIIDGAENIEPINTDKPSDSPKKDEKNIKDDVASE